MSTRYNPHTGKLDIVGDTYESAEDPTTESAVIGGIKKPTSLAELLEKTGGKVSGVLDYLIFPENQPVIVQPSVSLTTSKAKVVEAGSVGYKAADFTITPNRGSVSHAKDAQGNRVKAQPYAGEVITEESYMYINSNTVANKVNTGSKPAKFPAGDTKYYALTTFATGEVTPTTNKGNEPESANLKQPIAKTSKTSSAVTIQAYCPVYYGRIPSGITVTAETVKAGTKKLGKPSSMVIPGSETLSHAFIALPAATTLPANHLWTVKQVLDQNKFDNTAAFTANVQQIEITTDTGLTVLYDVYLKAIPDSGTALVYTATLN